MAAGWRLGVGPSLVEYWSSVGSVLVLSLGLLMVQYWFSTGSVVDWLSRFSGCSTPGADVTSGTSKRHHAAAAPSGECIVCYNMYVME